jgi:hypothetical protein
MINEIWWSESVALKLGGFDLRIDNGGAGGSTTGFACLLLIEASAIEVLIPSSLAIVMLKMAQELTQRHCRRYPRSS